MTRIPENSRVSWAAGTAAAPSAAAAYGVFDLDWGPAEKVNLIQNNSLIGLPMTGVDSLGDRMVSVSFSKYIEPQSATATPWFGGALLRACGMTEATAGATYAAFSYTFSTDIRAYSTGPVDAIDITVNRGTDGSSSLGLQEILKDCIGNASFTFRPGELAVVRFNFIGRINTSVATLSVASMSDTAGTAFGADPTPLITSNAAATVDGTSFPIREIAIDLGNTLIERPDINGDIGSYSAPVMGPKNTTMSILIEAPLLATKNFYSKAVARSTIAVTADHAAGTGAGSEVGVDFTGTINGQITHEIDRGVICARIPLKQALTPAAVNNAMKLAWLETA